MYNYIDIHIYIYMKLYIIIYIYIIFIYIYILYISKFPTPKSHDVRPNLHFHVPLAQANMKCGKSLSFGNSSVVGGDFIGKMWFLARHLKSHGFMIADWWFGT